MKTTANTINTENLTNAIRFACKSATKILVSGGPSDGYVSVVAHVTCEREAKRLVSQLNRAGFKTITSDRRGKVHPITKEVLNTLVVSGRI